MNSGHVYFVINRDTMVEKITARITTYEETGDDIQGEIHISIAYKKLIRMSTYLCMSRI